MTGEVNEYAITTFDNPYDPFEQFAEWDLFDKEQGYNSNQRVARLLEVSDDMTENEMAQAYERAIDLLISIDFTNTFKKIKRNKSN
jgi:hypothetical protein